jgi:lipopolysaccharide transport system ATP-binding protein
MSDDIAIRVESLAKRYYIGHERRQDTLRGAIHHGVRGFWNAISRRRTESTKEEFWALRDVSFEVKKGEVLGIIGRNGAGKSTLLKILSRITDPTSGRARIQGRVASLLEVGTGFHPELSGRENIFLNGTILGMTRVEIRGKFDEIVEFAEVAKFIDTPVKHYSSGMYVRLAFAVAAHLEPEILIIDEVLAVGDGAFQKKCLGKMQSVSRGDGRTVLFVSHNLTSVRQLCRSAILLNGGKLQAAGSSSTILDLYAESTAEHGTRRELTPSIESRDWCFATAVSIETTSGKMQSVFSVGEKWQIAIGFQAAVSLQGLVINVSILTIEGNPIQTAWSLPKDFAAGKYSAIFRQNSVSLEAGAYVVYVGFQDSKHAVQQFEAVRFDVTGEEPVGHFPRTFGAGVVLNSMEVEIGPANP